jgi:LL-diaminopimelate aminotransferase
MSKANPNFQKLKRDYIFPVIDKKLEKIRQDRPDTRILNFGVGDVVLPIRNSIIKALVQAVQEMGEIPHGYGPSVGYPFLRKAIVDHEYGKYGINANEVFISEGTKADSVNLLELFDKRCKIAIQDPTYPSYLDACIMDGRTKMPKKSGLYSDILYLPCTPENHFIPTPPKRSCHVVYLCSPNNPTGVALTRKDLEEWIAYARSHNAVIILDAAYEAFISSPDVPRSIYELPFAQEVAIELRSFSKSAGFTGLRCAYAIIPNRLQIVLNKQKVSLNSLWTQRQNIKTNGIAYPIQKAAEAALKKTTQEETKQDIQYYLTQAKRLKEALLALNQTCYGGVDCPYIWWKVPNLQSSWEFCDHLINTLQIVTIPGSAFGVHGEGFIRLSTFATDSDVDEAILRLQQLR